MNPLRLLVLLVTLPLLLGGCGGDKNEPVGEVKPELEGVDTNKLVAREGIYYIRGSDTPYTGKCFELYDNGQKSTEGNFKYGKKDGLWLMWHKNGQKSVEGNFKDGKLVGSQKWWNSKGESVDSKEEAKAE